MFFRNHEKMPGEKLTTSMRRAGRRTSVNAVNAVSAVTTETAKNRTLKKWSQFSQMDFSFQLALWMVRSPNPLRGQTSTGGYPSPREACKGFLRFGVSCVCLLGMLSAPVYLLVSLRTQIPHDTVGPDGEPAYCSEEGAKPAPA